MFSKTYAMNCLKTTAGPIRRSFSRKSEIPDGRTAGAVCRGDVQYIYTVDRLREHEIDYALISYFRHSSDERSLVAIQGVSTVATRAAAEFLADDARINELQKLLKVDSVKTLPSFEVVLEVSVRGYVPVGMKLHDHFIHPRIEPLSN